MKESRFLRQRGRVDGKTLPRGANGRALCRRCNEEVPAGRRTFCGDNCVHQWRLRTQGDYLRQQVFARDRGRCSGCGVDTADLEQKIRRLWRTGKQDVARRLMDRLGMAQLLDVWFTQGRNRSAWEAHHIKAVVEGGGQCGLSNLCTLCLHCHAKMTSRQRFSRASSSTGGP